MVKTKAGFHASWLQIVKGVLAFGTVCNTMAQVHDRQWEASIRVFQQLLNLLETSEAFFWNDPILQLRVFGGTTKLLASKQCDPSVLFFSLGLALVTVMCVSPHHNSKVSLLPNVYEYSIAIICAHCQLPDPHPDSLHPEELQVLCEKQRGGLTLPALERCCQWAANQHVFSASTQLSIFMQHAFFFGLSEEHHYQIACHATPGKKL